MLDWLIDFTLITKGTDILFVVLLVFPLSFGLLIGAHRRSKKCEIVIPDAPRSVAPPTAPHDGGAIDDQIKSEDVVKRVRAAFRMGSYKPAI